MKTYWIHVEYNLMVFLDEKIKGNGAYIAF